MAIALIEVKEEHLQDVGVPFILYGVYKTASNKKLSAAHRVLADLRKQMSNQYRIIEDLEESNNGSKT